MRQLDTVLGGRGECNLPESFDDFLDECTTITRYIHAVATVTIKRMNLVHSAKKFCRYSSAGRAVAL